MRTLLAVAVAATLLGPLAASRPAYADVTFDQKMLELINQKRAAAGVAPVQGSLVLSTIAGPGPYLGCGLAIGGRASDMGDRNYFSHTILSCNNQSVFNILSSTAGLVYSAAAENIAWMNGTTDPLVAAERLMNDLMNSPAHRTNILDPRFTDVGIGSWRTPAGASWTGAGSPLMNVWITAQVFVQMPLAAAPAVSISPSSVGFGDRAVGATGPTQAVAVKNTGSASLSITGTSITGTNAGDFSVASNSCGTSLAAGATCTIAVAFTPTATGSRSASLTLSGNATGSPFAVALTGNGTPAPLPGPPVNVVATGGEAQISVTWAPPTSGPAATGYGIFVYDAAGFVASRTCSGCTSAVVNGLVNGKQYYAAVYSSNGSQWGGASFSNWAWALKTPAAPTQPAATPGNGSLTMTWRTVNDPAAGVDGHTVFVYDANGYTGRYASVCATCTTATVTGLTNGGTYVGIVYAHNANGWGAMAASGWIGVGTPGIPGNVVASKATNAVNVSWTAATTGGAAIVGYGAYAYDSTGYTGKSAWVCGTCLNATVAELTAGKQYTVLVYAYNDFGWGLPAYSNAVTL